MAVKQYIVSILLLLQGSLMVHSNEIKVMESKVIFRAQWGEEDNQIPFEKGLDFELSFILNSFLIMNNSILIFQQFDEEYKMKYFDKTNKLLYIEDFKKYLTKYRPFTSYFILEIKRYSTIYINALCFLNEMNGNIIRLLLLKINTVDRSIQILNDNLPKKPIGDHSFLSVTSNGGSLINQEGDLHCYDENGKLIAEIANKKIMYADKYGHIYIRESDNRVGVYDIKNKRIAYFDVPPEIGTDFKIDGGDVDSYLYQWKWDSEHLSIEEYYAAIHLYKLKQNKESNVWFMNYEGYVTLGVCHNKGKSKLFKNVEYDKINYIDYRNELLQIDPDGTIYHIERDEKEMRIICKKIEAKK